MPSVYKVNPFLAKSQRKHPAAGAIDRIIGTRNARGPNGWRNSHGEAKYLGFTKVPPCQNR